MKKKIYLLIGTLAMCLSSCEKFITQDPQYLLTPEVAVTDEASAKALLNGAYARINTNDWTARFTGGFSSMLGVATYNSSAYSFNMQSTGDNEALWKAFYVAANSANAAIAGITPLADSKFSNPQAKKQFIGEAHGIRAFAHLYNMWFFGRWFDQPESQFGIIYRSELSVLGNVYQPRLTVKESYDKLIADLDFTIANAADFYSNKRVSKQLAKALKAKLLLNRGWANDYASALVLVNEAITESMAKGVALEPSLTQLYANSWDSKELLFCRYREKTDDVIAGYNFTYGYNYATMGLNNVPGNAVFASDPRHAEGWGNVKSPIQNNNTLKWAPKKLARLGRQVGGDNDKYTAYYLRLTELYLMKAELLQKTGASFAQAMEPINLVRARSGLTALSVSTKVDFEKTLFNEILQELNLENEADWMSSLRLKNAAGTYLLQDFRGSAVVLDPNRFVWPIPTSEMKFNRLISQNPGYENLSY
ncbi:RagB/SusD family nutrient uptake outer membrane protein [Pedobacter insulae]|uniref:Starch-binding associating with outer membrane n=1 Tax=Pedobacter insulae TaxID=414048 RepID=A0A1I2T107_9SPHI|nr:RagB/SusD family nutrient uptake outer membrane protein [Pedobacter insulae]SFG56126.1 Starch-binding associating with outer membrane [Pedobacter insulae]